MYFVASAETGERRVEVGDVDDVADTWPSSIIPGHHANAGTRTPPSVKSPLPPRYIMGSMPQPAGGLCTIGPLSAMATKSVFSAMPSSLSSFMTLPTNASSFGKEPATFQPRHRSLRHTRVRGS